MENCAPLASVLSLILVIAFARGAADSISGCPDRKSEAGLTCLFEKVYPGYGIVDFKDDALGKIGVYGELKPAGVKKILDFAGVGTGDVFYDLGCGTGKVVLQVALEADVDRAVGAELAHPRAELAKDALASLKELEPKAMENVLFHEGDFFKLDLSDATVIFTASLVFPDDVLRNLEGMVTTLPPGTMIISLRQFDGCHPGLVQHRLTLQLAATWGAGVGYVYTVGLRWAPPVDLYAYKTAEKAAGKELSKWPVIDEPMGLDALRMFTGADVRSKRLMDGKDALSYDAALGSLMHRARGQFSSPLQCLWEELYASSKTAQFDMSYSELFEVEVASMLEACPKECVFADLGSGKGKVVLQSAVSGLVSRALGIESESPRHKIAQEALQIMGSMGVRHAPVEFLEGDFVSLMQNSSASPNVLLLNVPLKAEQRKLLAIWLRTLAPGTTVFTIEEWTLQEATAARMKKAERTLRLYQYTITSESATAALEGSGEFDKEL
eukprot:gnl/MRDRNA2_/MRDRNA2_113102_c0_seq1.p1 gnl/MRDRNA2_/MRDRNA2_113102_c0~~gnl/MRDRNA2_/MRDRNA2_113102_c0_seq1.p1  ORF type:complete len:497 (+),score=102.81 gnl/MRDRNA2_/MRDRNA2_113102_c0_seq1:141-1631(+)